VRADLSNDDPLFLRNRVRSQLVPLLTTYNPRITDALSRFGEIAAADEAELTALAQQAWSACAKVEDAQVRFQRADWEAVSVSVQRRLLRLAVDHLSGPGASPGFAVLEAARVGVGRTRRNRTYELGGGLLVEVATDAIAVHRISDGADGA
jgi:tRNA(Ile)-lysidine synthase